jgi:phenylalanyl-tRNA synthetase beta chain
VPLGFAPATHPALHPRQSAAISTADGTRVGWIGALHPRLAQAFDLQGSPVLFELDLAVLQGRSVPAFTEFSRFPPAIRDLALVVSDAVAAGELLAAIDGIRRSEPALGVVQSVRLFDEYRGKGLENKEKSLAFRFWMQDTQRTLSDAEVESAMRVIVERLAGSHGARLRSS